ncbi:class I SAM-dependent methyltransferase [Oricola thermophila]|uniref:Class I SAM-dependent methyltransferase n=1 Tax=Oricola thermophila TaxID=2742145 RepID=A0A6N1VCS7_9HYPH|nr:class I SAM-dependent methyltransferase [Oricola thermophila]QKV17375.1 class I SAM-dependent methyltransferase [Oricola thermophila]
MARVTEQDSEAHGRLMDAIYRNQRHVYDLTRKYYLLGRDRLIADLAAGEGTTILEAACGTGRNLIVAARRYPKSSLYGFDISSEMLKQASRNIDRAGLSDRIVLAQADATGFDPQALFGVASFDRIFLSYAVSMIPPWRAAIAEAARHLADDGALHVVDFGQQERLPGWFRAGLQGWLAKFHVEPRKELERGMAEAAQDAGATLRFESLCRDYARYGVIRR